MRAAIVLIGLGLMLGLPTSASALDPDIKCEADKIKTAGKYTVCLAGTYSKAVRKGQPETEKLAQCDAKYAKKWDQIEAKAAAHAPPPCPTTGDEAAIQAKVQQFVNDLLLSLEGPGCGGEEVGGACWFLGVGGASCDATCGSAGLSYDAATETYAGSGGSLSQCFEVMDALQGAAHGADVDPCGNGLGCHELGFVVDRCVTPATDSTSSQSDVARACACQ